MRLVKLRALTMLACAVAVSSCGSKVVTRLTFPPAADLKQEAEPEFPLAALEPGEEGVKAENAWRDKVLIWGRRGWQQNRRVCQWAVDLGMSVPTGYCSR
jgi:hypothetical protein